MIAEIAVSQAEEPRGSVSLIENLSGLQFIVDTAKRINKVPLAELEAKLPEFIQRRNQNAFVLGGVLERIRREKFWNPGSRRPKNACFEHWVEETCHYSGRKARYLISVYTGLVEAAIPSARISSVGWSKLRMIAPLLRPANGADAAETEDNKVYNEQLVTLACSKSRKALEGALKRLSPDTEVAPAVCAPKPKPRQYVFKVSPDDAGVVDAALAKIAKEGGHTGGAALVVMANAINGRLRHGAPLAER